MQYLALGHNIYKEQVHPLLPLHPLHNPIIYIDHRTPPTPHPNAHLICLATLLNRQPAVSALSWLSVPTPSRIPLLNLLIPVTVRPLHILMLVLGLAVVFAPAFALLATPAGPDLGGYAAGDMCSVGLVVESVSGRVVEVVGVVEILGFARRIFGLFGGFLRRGHHMPRFVWDIGVNSAGVRGRGAAVLMLVPVSVSLLKGVIMVVGFVRSSALVMKAFLISVPVPSTVTISVVAVVVIHVVLMTILESAAAILAVLVVPVSWFAHIGSAVLRDARFSLFE